MDDWYKIIHDPSKNIFQKLDEQVDTFWQWSKTIKHEFEWEVSFPNWELIYTIFDKLIETTSCRSWDHRTVNNLLFIIGRDNESELLIRKITDFPERLYFLGKEGIAYPDSDTKWQLANYLTKCLSTHADVEEIILKYYQDQNEYVKRRALLALGIINSKYAEQCAIESWNTGMKYQRLAALEVLKQLKSPYFSELQNRSIEK
ncbi:HEAT repeat domain-containing protein [Brevibacillus sp. SYSU BS000544]|uniref:HEAT repeat domain-containing protein n=1 Tax=Brevibacillus sp. SYSU BS000544 TaxID=3416443 RepID=UPI003CE46106